MSADSAGNRATAAITTCMTRLIDWLSEPAVNQVPVATTITQVKPKLHAFQSPESQILDHHGQGRDYLDLLGATFEAEVLNKSWGL